MDKYSRYSDFRNSFSFLFQNYLFCLFRSYCLPFINSTIEISKYFGLILPFTKHTTIRKLQQKYSIISMDKYFPTGPLTIREQDAQIQITQNDIQIENLNGNQPYVILEPDGGQQIYEYEIHQMHSKRNTIRRNSKLKRFILEYDKSFNKLN